MTLRCGIEVWIASYYFQDFLRYIVLEYKFEINRGDLRNEK